MDRHIYIYETSCITEMTLQNLEEIMNYSLNNAGKINYPYWGK